MSAPTVAPVETPTELTRITLDPKIFGREIDDGSSSPDEVAHLVDQRFEQDVTTAYIMGTELVALCGHRWVPTKSPDEKKICKLCAEEFMRINS